jgi:hypothetical protein
MTIRLLPPAVWVFLLALIAAPGCGGSDELNSPTAVKLKAIGKLYLDFVASSSGKGPASEKEFKRHLRGLPDHVLSGNGMDPKAIDEAFVSGRDKEPFVIRYGIVIKQISGKSMPLVAHEKTGKDGKRLVGFANGNVDLVDEARLQELTSAK